MTKMRERHHRYGWYGGSSKQSGGGKASISQIYLGSDVLKRMLREEEVYIFVSLSVPSGDPLYNSDNFHVCCFSLLF